ncbi:hypothetical protein BDR07DRAFT_1433503 [Suillus spraguei]|nr:hypothetical protein BDR07DRAFT_1433503 [Suillus spraguei]
MQPVGEPLRGHVDSVNSVSFSPDGTRIVTGSDDKTVRLWASTMTLNTLDNPFISFSSNSIHSLCDTSELTEGASHDDRSSTPFVLNVDSGWVVGPKRRLLFWVPPAARYSFWSPGTVLVLPRGPELDLSRMAHGQHWQRCQEG